MLEFVPVTAKHTIPTHKRFKKSEILVTGKSCIASEAWSEFILGKVHVPYYGNIKIKKESNGDI